MQLRKYILNYSFAWCKIKNPKTKQANNWIIYQNINKELSWLLFENCTLKHKIVKLFLKWKTSNRGFRQQPVDRQTCRWSPCRRTQCERQAEQTDGSDTGIHAERMKGAEQSSGMDVTCMRVCLSACQSETFCLSSLLRTRPHSLAPVLGCLLCTGVCGWLDRWLLSTQQCCSKRSQTEFKFISETKTSVIPKLERKFLKEELEEERKDELLRNPRL